MNKKYIIGLTATERQDLESMVKKGKTTVVVQRN